MTDDWTLDDARRNLPDAWLGTTTFFKPEFAPKLRPKEEDTAGSSDEVKEPSAVPGGAQTVGDSAKRKERKYKGSSKPDWVDSASWVSMSPKVRSI
jgi:hypothetical protein